MTKTFDAFEKFPLVIKYFVNNFTGQCAGAMEEIFAGVDFDLLDLNDLKLIKSSGCLDDVIIKLWSVGPSVFATSDTLNRPKYIKSNSADKSARSRGSFV